MPVLIYAVGVGCVVAVSILFCLDFGIGRADLHVKVAEIPLEVVGFSVCRFGDCLFFQPGNSPS